MSGSMGNQKNNTTENYSGTTMPIIPDEWKAQNQALTDLLGRSGITPQQQGNINALQNLLPGQNAYTQAGYYSLADLSKNFGGEWATPDAIAAQNVGADQVSSQPGANFMSAYQNPWDRDVIDASVADYNANVDRTANAMRAGRDAAGAFGDRAAIADAVYQGDASRGLGSLVSGLRQQGFNTAAGYGQQDASRALQAAGMNQAANLQAASTNAANTLAAQQFNNSLTNDRQQFSVNEALQGDQNRMQAYRDMQNNILAQSGIAQGGVDNLLQQLGVDTATFGSKNEGTTTSSSKTKSKGGGF